MATLLTVATVSAAAETGQSAWRATARPASESNTIVREPGRIPLAAVLSAGQTSATKKPAKLCWRTPNLPGRNVEPATPVAQTPAAQTPVREPIAASNFGRQPTVGAASVRFSGAVADVPQPARAGNSHRSATPVVPAAHHEYESVNPFDDPFGDRIAQSTSPARRPDVAPPTTGTTPDRIGAPTLGEAAPGTDITAEPPTAREAPRPASPELLPGGEIEPQVDPGQEDPLCNMFFRERDFCEEQRECQQGWRDLKDNPITSIDLNITPRFQPDEDEREKEIEYRRSQLSPHLKRKWRNRENQLLGFYDGEVLGLDGEDWWAAYQAERIELDAWERRNPGRDKADFPTRFSHETGEEPRELDGGMVEFDDQTLTIQLADSLTSRWGVETVELPFDKLSRNDNLFVRGREWVDRLGRKRAEGRMVDYFKGEVHIETDDGEIVKVPFLALNQDAMSWVSAYWGIPAECKLPDVLRKMPGDAKEIRDFTLITMTWKASGLCHKPLYFEERALERYGHSVGPIAQPFLSGAHFFATPFILPYKMGINPPNECQYSLGYYRPGSCAPYMVPPVPISPRGALLEAGAMVGGVFLIP